MAYVKASKRRTSLAIDTWFQFADNVMLVILGHFKFSVTLSKNQASAHKVRDSLIELYTCVQVHTCACTDNMCKT